MKKIYLYDFDNCIIKGDVTEGFLNYYIGIPEYLFLIGKANTSTYQAFQEYNENYWRQYENFNTNAFTLPLSLLKDN